MAGKRYFVYKLTGPSGRSYVGFTGQAVKERWRQHVGRASRTGDKRHPLYDAIRASGAGSFRVEILFETKDLRTALEREKQEIAALEKPYNIGPGGELDWAYAVAAFQAKLANDPEWAAAYRAKLSTSMKASEAYRLSRPQALKGVERWRKENSRERWKITYRAMRSARKVPHAQVEREYSEEWRKAQGERIRAGHAAQKPSVKLRRSRNSRAATTKLWAERSPDQVIDISAKISKSVEAMHAAKTSEEKAAGDAQLAEARKSIDHTVRKARQKERLIAYWTPERRAAKGAAMRARAAALRAS